MSHIPSRFTPPENQLIKIPHTTDTQTSNVEGSSSDSKSLALPQTQDQIDFANENSEGIANAREAIATLKEQLKAGKPKFIGAHYDDPTGIGSKSDSYRKVEFETADGHKYTMSKGNSDHFSVESKDKDLKLNISDYSHSRIVHTSLGRGYNSKIGYLYGAPSNVPQDLVSDSKEIELKILNGLRANLIA